MSTNSFNIDGLTSLRPGVTEDAGRLFSLVEANRAHLRAWLPWLDGSRCVEEIEAFLASAAQRREAGRGGVWIVEHRGVLCGVTHLNHSERAGEVGYWLDAGHEGRGIMTRCVSRLVRHAFEDLHLERITISVAVENQRSRAIPERLGFHAERVIHDAEWLYDHHVDHVLYVMAAMCVGCGGSASGTAVTDHQTQTQARSSEL